MPELKSSPQYRPKYQMLASFWAKSEEERRRDREKRKRGDRERIGRLDDWTIGRLGDWAMFEGIFDCRFSIADIRFIWNFMTLIILKWLA